MMEVGSLGAAYMNMDDYRSSAASKVQDSNFASLLERAAAVQNNANNASGSAKTKVDKTDKLYGLCLELETFLVKNLLTGMRNTVQKSGLIDDSYAGKMYEDMLYDEYAKDFAKNASFGLAEQAYLQLTNASGKVFPATLD